MQETESNLAELFHVEIGVDDGKEPEAQGRDKHNRFYGDIPKKSLEAMRKTGHYFTLIPLLRDMTDWLSHLLSAARNKGTLIFIVGGTLMIVKMGTERIEGRKALLHYTHTSLISRILYCIFTCGDLAWYG